MMILVFLLVAAVVGAGAVITVVGTARIEAAHPAAGRLVEVEGGRLHVLEIGPPVSLNAAAPEPEPPIVLIHGASGNLQDLRLALGDRLAVNRRVVLVDRPGHGWSDRPGGGADASPARAAAIHPTSPAAAASATTTITKRDLPMRHLLNDRRFLSQSAAPANFVKSPS